MELQVKRCGGMFDRARRCSVSGAIAALAALSVLLGGCNRDEVVRAFRAGASDQLQAGVESIALGVIDGVFSAFDVGSGDAGASGSTESP